MVVSGMSLMAISADRMVAVVAPFHDRLTRRCTLCLVLVAWLAGFTLAVPFAIYRNYHVSRGT